jgi:hypothetical protein
VQGSGEGGCPTSRAGGDDEGFEAELAAGTAAFQEAKYRRIGQTKERYQAIQKLLAAGHSRRAIADHLGLAYNTVRCYAAAGDVEELLATGWQNQPTILDAFKPYLHDRLRSEGRVSDTALFREIRALGYRGSCNTVGNYLRELRGTDPTRRMQMATPVLSAPPPKTRDVAAWITTPPQCLGEDDQVRLKAVLQRCPDLQALTGYVRDFAGILTGLRADELPGWLNAVYVCDVPSLHTFVNGIDRDYAAVTAGLSLPWSSGACEGTVNRVKMLMRQMFGRAGFPRLRKRILLA